MNGSGNSFRAVPDWVALRELFPAAQKFAYLDHAANGPEPRPVVEAVAAYLRSCSERGYLDEPYWLGRVREIRAQAAEMIGAGPQEVAFFESVSQAAGIVAHSLRLRPGDNVVTSERQFPSNVLPWLNLRRMGVEARTAPWTGDGVRAEDVLALIDRRTRVVALSLVEYSNGVRLPIEAIGEACRRQGIRLFVDAIQAVGAIPVDVEALKADFLAFGSHKWLCGPNGVTVLYIRKDVLEEMHPLTAGWLSVPSPFNFDDVEQPWIDAAARFEGGTQNVLGIVGLGASLGLFLSVGMGAVAERLRHLTGFLRAELRAIGAEILTPPEPQRSAGIVSFRLGGLDESALAEVRKRWLSEGVVVSVRGGAIRVSPQFYNNEDDLARLLELVRHMRT